MSDNYSSKVVVITGASSGFGRGTAVELVKRGAKVVLAARSSGDLAAIVEECSGSSGEAISLHTDVSVTQDVQKLFEYGLSSFGHIDVWVNAAGVAAIGRFGEIPLADH